MYKADPLDVANLAMMLHQNGQCIELPHEARMRAEASSTYQEVVAQRDALLSALENLVEQASGFNVSGVYFNEFVENMTALDIANDAIAQAKGETL